MLGNTKWERLQQEQFKRYKESPIGVFSVKETKGAHVVGEQVNKRLKGKLCLDIGSGALPKPYYMKIANDVRWVGIDPYKGKPKSYSFVQGYGEQLPFRGNWFDGVLFATSLDHILYPRMAVNEARRVLKKKGLLFLWQTLVDGSKPLMEEEYKNMHMTHFTMEKMLDVFRAFELIEEITIKNLQKLFIFRK